MLPSKARFFVVPADPGLGFCPIDGLENLSQAFFTVPHTLPLGLLGSKQGRINGYGRLKVVVTHGTSLMALRSVSIRVTLRTRRKNQLAGQHVHIGQTEKRHSRLDLSLIGSQLAFCPGVKPRYRPEYINTGMGTCEAKNCLSARPASLLLHWAPGLFRGAP